MYDFHVFVCLNERVSGHARGCCHSKGSTEVHRALKAKARALPYKIRVNKSGCLDQCEQGTAVVIYPEAKWFFNVSLDEVDEIMDHIKQQARNEIINEQK